ncbi:MAG: Hint domain-containing protein [Hyphomicrobiaceae bacterium]
MAVSQGDIAFVAFSGGNNGGGGFAFVTLAPLTAGTTITFTDQNWSGSAFTGSEGSLAWTVPTGGLATGTLVEIATSAGPSTNIGTAVATGPAIELNFDDGIYAISGTVGAPGTFIAAVTNTSAGIASTGLIYGSTALDLGTFANAGVFNGLDVGSINAATASSTFANVVDARAAYNSSTNWVFDANNGGGLVDWPALTDPQSPLNGFTALQVCFLAGTMIRTPDGETAIEALAIGDLIVTADGSPKPVKFIGRQTVSMIFADASKTQPIQIRAGALGENVPTRDLFTSPGHSMLIDGVLAISAALVNGSSIVRWQDVTTNFTYFHIELDDHAIIFAEGAATETYCDNVPREVFDNGAEYKALYPNAKPITQLDMPTVKSQRQLPAATKKRLAERAAAIGALVEAVA